MEVSDEESWAPEVSNYAKLQEQHACYQSRIASLRQEQKELKAKILHKQRNQSDFQNQMNDHLESVAHQKQLLSTRAEGLEMEQRQLHALEAQHKQEERSLRPRIDEAVADRATTEARIQVLMDRLVVLLSSAAAATGTMMSQTLEEFQGSLLNHDEKIQIVKGRLETARRENHDFAVRLSEEQSETKRLHDKLCSLQSRLYNGRLQKEARAVAGEQADPLSRKICTEEDINSVASSSAELYSSGLRGNTAQVIPAMSSTTRSIRMHLSTRKANQNSEVPATDNGLGDRHAVEAMEAILTETLDKISFQEPVVRVRQGGLYKFGADHGFLARSSDGTVLARPGLDGTTPVDGSGDWVPLEDFLEDLCLKHSRESERRASQMTENLLAQVPNYEMKMRPDSDHRQHLSQLEVAPTTLSKTEDDRSMPALANAGDDAAGYGGKTSVTPEEERKPPHHINESETTQKQIVATNGDDAAGREAALEEVIQFLQSPPLQNAGHNGDEAAGYLHQMEKRNNTISKGGLVGVGAVPSLQKMSSAQRISEQPCEANSEKAANLIAPRGSSLTHTPAETASNNGGRTSTQASAHSLATTASTTNSSRAPSLPASPQLGARPLGSIRSLAGMMSPTRLASPRKIGMYGATSPTRMPLGSKTAGTASPSKQPPQARAQPPPALTPRQVVPPQRALAVPVSAPPYTGNSSPSHSRPKHASPSPLRAVPRSNSPRQHVPTAVTCCSGVTTSPRTVVGGNTFGVASTTPRIPSGMGSHGGFGESGSNSLTAPVGKRVTARAIGESSAGGSIELPVSGSAVSALGKRSQSTSPDRRQETPPAVRTGPPGRFAVRTPSGSSPLVPQVVRRR